jgi:hypothetical protein
MNKEQGHLVEQEEYTVRPFEAMKDNMAYLNKLTY